ncbi:hypothetical protein GCM10009080_00630 [Cupriavidus pauculus]
MVDVSQVIRPDDAPAIARSNRFRILPRHLLDLCREACLLPQVLIAIVWIDPMAGDLGQIGVTAVVLGGRAAESLDHDGDGLLRHHRRARCVADIFIRPIANVPHSRERNGRLAHAADSTGVAAV